MASTLRQSCPACGEQGTSPYMTYNGYLLLRCAACTLIFTEQRDFVPGQYANTYSSVDAYREMLNDATLTFEGKKGIKDLWWFKRRALDWIVDVVPHGHLLDIGSGPGTFLMVANRTFGYAVQGVEPALPAADLANKYGVPTFCGTAEEYLCDRPRKFDVVTSFEALEHISEPLSTLISARHLIKENGFLIISVPNLDDPYCLSQQIEPAMPPVHINFFSRKSLGLLLNRAGFDLKRAFTLPIPSSTVRNIHGRSGFLLRLPYLVTMRLLGRADGTTLLAMASANVSGTRCEV